MKLQNIGVLKTVKMLYWDEFECIFSEMVFDHAQVKILSKKTSKTKSQTMDDKRYYYLN